MPIQSVNPFNGSVVQSYEPHSVEEVEHKIAQTHKAWLQWKTTSFGTRSKHLLKTAEVLRSHAEDFARLMALEMGKPLKSGISEVEKCAVCCEYYAQHAESFLNDELIETEASKSYVSFQPLGVILTVMPWNFPFWQLFRFLAPALMSGNCGVLKHASNVPGCAIAIEETIKEAGFPEHVFQTLLVGSEAVEDIIKNPLIKAVSLTGSTDAGKKVAQTAASVLKKSVLELGGSDAYLILADADLGRAAEVCAESRLINSGQSCIAAKRFIVLEEVEKEFIRLLKANFERKILGDPLNEKTDVGPQARVDLRDNLHQQVLKSIKLGAQCILGGFIPEGNNALYPPTILTNVKKGMPAYDDETFGPVAAVISAANEEEAIAMANDTVFGLGAAIFSRDIAKAEKIAANLLEAGSCFVNESVKSDPRLPFGGIKQSGYGRELGIYGIKEFVNIKTIVIR